MEFAKTTFPARGGLAGVKVVVDAPTARPIGPLPKFYGNWAPRWCRSGVSPNGTNINQGCGSTDTTAAAEAVGRPRAPIWASVSMVTPTG